MTNCPQCRSELVSITGGLPWCPACRWNLGTYDPNARPPHGWKWLDRRGHRYAFELDRSLVQRYHGVLPADPPRHRSRLALTVLAVVLLAACLGCCAVGVLLLTPDHSFLQGVAGVLLIAVAALIRPRPGRLPRRRTRLDPATAPELVALIGAVAAAVGTAAPDFVVIDSSYNMAVASSGLPRRRTLYIGTALWVTFDPAMRVSVLAHELGHFVAGDPNRNLLVQPALTTFGRLARWTGADQTFEDVIGGSRRTVLPRLALFTVSRIFLVLHLALTAIGFRDRQHAEIRADAVAVRVAGRDAALRSLRRLVVSSQVSRILAYAAETHPPREWRRLVEQWEAAHPAEVALQTQLTLRTTSLWDSHPPSGARVELALSWPESQASDTAPVDIDAVDWARVDASLAVHFRHLHERVLGRRDYRPQTGRAR